MDVFYIFLVIVLVVIPVYLWFFVFPKWKIIKGIRKDLSGNGIAGHLAEFRFDCVTPKGVRVKSTVVVPDTVLLDIDEGIGNQISRHNAKYPTWDKYKLHTDYDVLFIEPMAENVETEPGSPAVLVQGIQSAGTCIGVWPRSGAKKPYIVLPHQQKQEWKFRDYLMRSTWHESEHVREFANDYGIFLMYVGAGDAHPHVP